MTWNLATVVPVWVLTIVGALLVAFLAPTEYLTWLPIAFAGAVLLTFAIQLGVHRKEDFVNRIMASIGGSVVLLAVATAVLAIS